jgi:glycosyltransferase involved in cell wall biosynthesis
MKVLHLAREREGGAGIAAFRLVESLRHYTDIHAELIFRETLAGTAELPRLPLGYRALCRLETFALKYSHTSNAIFRSTGLVGNGIVPEINQSDADIVHLHWINGAFLSIFDIAQIQKPLVWTLHDSWPFCGTEHHPDILQNDLRWRYGYKKSNRLPDSTGLDLDKWVWLWKKYCWKKLKISFVAPSIWEANMLRQSALFNAIQCAVIPNGVNTDIFQPGDKIAARKKLQLPLDKKIILFGAAFVNAPLKGGHLLIEALNKLFTKMPNIMLVCFGNGKIDNAFVKSGISEMTLGSLQDTELLVAAYRAADVFICPSLIDNLPGTCVEAEACGVPVAAFRVGGIPDIVIRRQTGFLAEPYNIDDLCNGILYCLQNSEELGRKAREHAIIKFNYESVAKQFEALYKKVLKYA